jgi:hypothetical protein
MFRFNAIGILSTSHHQEISNTSLVVCQSKNDGERQAGGEEGQGGVGEEKTEVFSYHYPSK